jgi:hypothetical protein
LFIAPSEGRSGDGASSFVPTTPAAGELPLAMRAGTRPAISAMYPNSDCPSAFVSIEPAACRFICADTIARMVAMALVSLAERRAPRKRGIAKLVRMAMIATTMSNSTSVKPRRW